MVVLVIETCGSGSQTGWPIERQMGVAFPNTYVLIREFEWQLSQELRQIYHAATALTCGPMPIA